jgi:endogenous inhibitor of DNA gyrase (YacG/DUF329 family)
MKRRTCPICRKAAAAAPYQPFCSKRCADVDLQRWFAGVYAVPAAEPDEAKEGPVDDPET